MNKAIAIITASLALIFSTQAQETNKAAGSSMADNVRIQHNVEFLGKGRTEMADLYSPAAIPAHTRIPAIVIIHGGGWNDGQRNAKREINIGTTLARNGYVGVSVDYALSHGRDMVWPTNLYDCKNAVRWLRVNAERLQVDPAHIGVIGGSAGGHLAALVALTDTEQTLEPPGPYPGVSDHVDCCVDLYGIADVGTFESHASMLGKTATEAPELYRVASPITYVRGSSPPFLIIHGTADKTVSPHQSELFDSVLTKAGVEHQLVWVQDAPHSFTLEPKQQDLRPLVVGFFDRHLKSVVVSPAH